MRQRRASLRSHSNRCALWDCPALPDLPTGLHASRAGERPADVVGRALCGLSTRIHSVSLIATGNLVHVPGSTSTNLLSIPRQPAASKVFFRSQRVCHLGSIR
jgi:hypothetical protein